MKPENYKQIKELMAKYEKIQDILVSLARNPIIRLSDPDHSYSDAFMTIGTESGCEHECTNGARSFVRSLMAHYRDQAESIAFILSTL